MIALWNLEPKYTNIALEKIRMYYQNTEYVSDYLPLEHHLYDKIYCSSLFDYTDKSQIPDDVILYFGWLQLEHPSTHPAHT